MATFLKNKKIMMPRLHCKLLCHSVSPHIQQLYTGFKMLKDNNLIEVTQEICRDIPGSTAGIQHLKNAAHAHLRVEVTDKDGRKSMLYFDCHDARDIDRTHLKNCDAYFKRSFSREYIPEIHPDDKDKIHPLGLNYWVFPDSVDLLAIPRNLSLANSTRQKLAGIITAIDSGNTLKFSPRLRYLHSQPIYSLSPRVLFMVNATNPHNDPDRSRDKIEERIHSNEFRAACVRMLRKELGPGFYGGLIPNKFTTAKYRDAVIDIPANTKKKNYLGIVGMFPICIATTGLHDSIGWKFAEYVAFSKAIVSERLHYEVPGKFLPGENYLEFSSPAECVEQSMKLLSDHELRNQIMSNNAGYYQHYVRPDRLIFNALSTAIKKWN